MEYFVKYIILIFITYIERENLGGLATDLETGTDLPFQFLIQGKISMKMSQGGNYVAPA